MPQADPTSPLEQLPLKPGDEVTGRCVSRESPDFGFEVTGVFMALDAEGTVVAEVELHVVYLEDAHPAGPLQRVL